MSNKLYLECRKEYFDYDESENESDILWDIYIELEKEYIFNKSLNNILLKGGIENE